MKHFNIFVLSLLIGFAASAVFTSCDNSEEMVEETPRPFPRSSVFWGYFEGTVGEEQFSLSNSIQSRPVVTSSGSFQWPDSVVLFMSTGIVLREDLVMKVVLHGIDDSRSPRYITDYDYDLLETKTDCIRLITGEGVDKTYYIPDKEHPVRAEIFYVNWVTSISPMIEVLVDGVFYNQKNPLDTIIVKARYGARQ